jgi:hypothetical protein
MSVAQLLDRAAAMGVTLRLEGDAVKVGGPRAAREVIRPELAAHKPEIVAHLRAASNDAVPADCVGALRSRDGGLYLPWGVPIPADQVREMQAELLGLIETLADYEGWPKDARDEVLTRATRGPLADLMPNLHHFRERVSEARTEYEARRLTHSRAWAATGRALANRGHR